MELPPDVSTSFVRIEDSWPAGRSLALIDALWPTHVILRRSGPPETLHLMGAMQAMIELRNAPESTTTGSAIRRVGIVPTPISDVHDSPDEAPGPRILMDEGRIIGFREAALPPAPVGYNEVARAGVGGGFSVRGSRGDDPLVFRDVMRAGGGGGGTGSGRSLVAEFPGTIALGQEASLVVSMSGDFFPDSALLVTLPGGSEVDVVVQPRRGLSLVGVGEGKLVVPAGSEEPMLLFRLRGESTGRGLVRVLAFHQGRPLGTISLAPVVAEADAAVGSAGLVREAGTLAPATVKQPDLSLLILESGQGGETALTLRLSATDPALGYNLKPFGPVKLRIGPSAYFQDFFRDIEQLAIRSPADKARAGLRIAAKGAGLFEALVPEDLRRALWSLRGRITSVQVQSEEPWIPWELCKLVGGDGSDIEEGPYLCEAFELTRWFPGLAQVSRLGWKDVAVVVPSDSRLAAASEERDFLLGMAGEGRKIERIPAKFLDVHAAMASGRYDGWHFTGHGSFRDEPNPDRSALILEAGERISPEDLGGRVANLGKAKPLVFLNACQVGQSEMGLTGIGGWAARFLRAGAGGFVGAYWSVYDKPALNFAKAFYTELLAGEPIGRAAQRARLAAKASGDPTWLAYTVFADPTATLAP